jgi:hypothetical protein
VEAHSLCVCRVYHVEAHSLCVCRVYHVEAHSLCVCRVYHVEAHSLCVAHKEQIDKHLHFDSGAMYCHMPHGILEVAYGNLRSYQPGPDTRSGQHLLFGLTRQPHSFVRAHLVFVFLSFIGPLGFVS